MILKLKQIVFSFACIIFLFSCDKNIETNIAMSTFALSQEKDDEGVSDFITVEIGQLEQFKKEGRDLDYLAAISLQYSLNIVSSINKSSFEKLEIQDFETNVNEINTKYFTMVNFIHDNKEEIKLSKQIDYENFLKKLVDFVDATNEMRIRKKDEVKFTKDERRKLHSKNAWLVKGSTQKVIKKYKVLLNYYNKLIK